MNRAQFFERRYREEAEPFEYSVRAAERIRHRWVAERAGRMNAGTAIDLGCSLGHITELLRDRVGLLVASDLSPTALSRTREKMNGDAMPEFVAASALELPFARGSFDLVIASDGLHSWHLDRDERLQALREIALLLSSGGSALLTEHMHPRLFERFLSEIRESGLAIVEVTYAYDRLWYQAESCFKAVRHARVVRAAFSNERFAHALARVGALIGRRASRHIYVVAQKAN